VSLPSIDELIAKGYGRSLTVGAFSTGIVGGGAGDVLDQDQPEFAIGVPAGYCMRPIYIQIVVHPGVTLADSSETEALVAVDSLGLWRGDGTVTIETPSNLRTDLNKGSALRCGSAFTGNMTTITTGGAEAGAAPVLDIELARYATTANFGDATGIIETPFVLTYEPKYPPFLVGPCTLLGYWGGTIATIGGFAIVQWVEGPIADLLPVI